MVDEIWPTVVVAVISIIGIVVAQFLSFRSMKGQMVLQTRASYFQEAYKDNMVVMHCITQIESGLDKEKNIKKIQNLIDEHPYNFSFGLLFNWCTIEEKLRSPNPSEEIKILCADIGVTMKVYSLKYYTEVLGIKPDEWKKLLEAMKGTLRT
jgi:hypothetical protein